VRGEKPSLKLNIRRVLPQNGERESLTQQALVRNPLYFSARIAPRN